MFRRALTDGNVWLAFGMACFALFFALEHWAGTSAAVEFARGALIGLALVAFGAAVFMLARRDAQPAPTVPPRPSATKKPRR